MSTLPRLIPEHIWIINISCIIAELTDVCSVHYHIPGEMKQSTKCFAAFCLLQIETDNEDKTII